MRTFVESIEVTRPSFLGGGNWTISRMTPLTVLFGKNGSGKSLLMRHWRDANPTSCHYVVPERTGEIGFNAKYVQQQLNANQRREITQGNYVSEYRQQIVARVQAYFLTRGSVRANQLPGDPAELERLIARLIPDIEVALDGSNNPPLKLNRFSNKTQISNVQEVSSGEAQILTVGLDALTMAAIWDIQQQGTRVLLIDEPDAHIHPDLQVRFADFLVEIARRFCLQVVVATHSTTLLAALGQFGDAETGVVYLDRTKREFRAERFSRVLKDLSTCLGGHALMGPLFGVPLLLVEGDDDYRIWSQVPRGHQVSFAVLPSNGQEIYQYQNVLEKVFAVLREENPTRAGFALIDGDKALPEANPSKPQNHVKFIKLNCRESENLYLSDEVLQEIGTTWDSACEKIANESAKFGEKTLHLSRVRAWDRKNEDIKDLIQQLTQIIDPKNVHWTIRVAATIGRSKPSGQLLSFLSDEVVAALWQN